MPHDYMKCAVAVLVLSAVGARTTTQGQTVTVFQSGFEPAEGYIPGNLFGQNEWLGYSGQGPNFGKVSNINPLSGSQSILLDCQDVQLGHAKVGRITPVPLWHDFVPLRYIEMSGKCAIVDPTIEPGHHSNVWVYQYHTDFRINFWWEVTGVAAGTLDAQYLFGWTENPSAGTVTVPPGVAFQFRQLVDYGTGRSTLWVDGQLVFQNFTQGFFPGLTTNELYFEARSEDNLPFDTKVWYDDIHLKGIYTPCEGDINGDAAADVDDLLGVITAWGPCPVVPAACLANIIDTGGSADRVDAEDLLAVIAGWGPCS